MTAKRPAHGPHALGAIAVVTLAVIGTPQAAVAQFLDNLSTGPQSLATADVAAPSGLVSSTAGCPNGNLEQTTVPLSWTGSTALDADGNYLVRYYDILRSAAGSGNYTSIGSTSGAPPPANYIDGTVTAGLPDPTYYAISGDTLEYNYGPSASWSAVGTYSFGTEENALAVTPDGTRLYVAETGAADHNVLVFDSVAGQGNALVSTVTLAGSGAEPAAIAMAPDGDDAYVLDRANDLVDVIPVPTPTGSYTVTTTIPVGDVGDPAAMAVSPDSSQLLVANYGSGTVSIINTTTEAVTTVTLPGTSTAEPMGIVVLPSGADAYVVDGGNAQVDEISLTGPTLGTVVAQLGVGNQGPTDTPADIDVADSQTAGPIVYVGNGGTTTVSAIFTATNSVTNITVGTATENPVALVAAPNGCYVAAVVSGTAGTAVSLVSTDTNTISSTTALPSPATCIAVQGSSSAYEAFDGPVVATPSELSYELQAAASPTGTGFESAYSSPITVTLGRGQVP